jgi:hypothetical protein
MEVSTENTTMNLAGSPKVTEQSFQRFESALRAVLSVPKTEVDKDVAREKKEREARKTDLS